MTDEKDPRDENADDDIYVIDDDDTGNLKDIEELAGYRSEPVPVDELAEQTSPPRRPEPGAGIDSEEYQKLQDKYLRSRADFENFRKRAEREKSEYFKYALASTIKELLPVLDNFERALSVEGGSGDDFRVGVEMIYKQFTDILERSGLKQIEPLHETFDPLFHEAIMREESVDHPANTITDVMQKGYLLNERLLRPALVKVSVGGPEKDEGDEPSSESESDA